jgi:trehalose 6-phosphate phosphatase
VVVSTGVNGLLDRFRANPDRAGILADFDGTLSPIVSDPAAAELQAGVFDALAGLGRRYRRVAVISGRPATFLAPRLPRSVVISGLYGLEVVKRGKRRDHPLAGSWREVIDDVASVSRAQGPAGMLVETKGLSLTLHYRQRPEIGADVRRWAERQATRSGLLCRPAKMSFELHPPIKADKGTAVHELADDLDAVFYVGDDVGDVQAFTALDELAEKGAVVVKVAVAGDEAPATLVDRADVVVEGPTGVLDLLRRL